MKNLRHLIKNITLMLIFSLTVIAQPQQEAVSFNENIIPENALGKIINTFIIIYLTNVYISWRIK